MSQLDKTAAATCSIEVYARKAVIRKSVWEHLRKVGHERSRKAMNAFYALMEAGPGKLPEHAGTIARAESERGKAVTFCVMLIEKLALIIKIKGIRVHLESVIDLLRLARRKKNYCCRVLREDIKLDGGFKGEFDLFVDATNRMVFRAVWVESSGRRVGGFGCFVTPL